MIGSRESQLPSSSRCQGETTDFKRKNEVTPCPNNACCLRESANVDAKKGFPTVKKACCSARLPDPTGRNEFRIPKHALYLAGITHLGQKTSHKFIPPKALKLFAANVAKPSYEHLQAASNTQADPRYY